MRLTPALGTASRRKPPFHALLGMSLSGQAASPRTSAACCDPTQTAAPVHLHHRLPSFMIAKLHRPVPPHREAVLQATLFDNAADVRAGYCSSLYTVSAQLVLNYHPRD